MDDNNVLFLQLLTKSLTNNSKQTHKNIKAGDHDNVGFYNCYARSCDKLEALI